MATIVDRLDQLDHRISCAYVALGVARMSWDHCPSADNTRLAQEAEDRVNELLEQRYAAKN
jgi:hypothetical protein